MKKAICVMICLFIFICILTSCTSKQPNDTVEQTTQEPTVDLAKQPNGADTPITLGYYSHQSLNPFKTQSKTNKNITTLLYDSLFKVDSNYNPVCEIAESFSFDEDGTLRVKLCDDIYFTNSNKLVASDVVYSFNKALAADLYKTHLSNFKSAYADGNEVVFNLYKNDIFAVNCLDFPVVEYGTADSDVPTGSGRYILKNKKNELWLSRNDSYSLPEELEQEKILLYDINETNNEIYLLQIGDLSFVYDDFSAGTPENKIGASSAQINLNNLVFLSFNSEKEIFDDINIKKGIMSAIDKTAVCTNVYDAFAKPCSSPFNPAWSVLSASGKTDNSEAVTDAAVFLDESGYIYEYKSNEYRSKAFEFLKLELAVCTKDEGKEELAKEVAASLRKAGIDITVTKYEKYDDYIKALRSGNFDMYLGEIKLSNNMSLLPFFTKGASASYGIDTTSTVTDAYFDFTAGKIDVSTFIKVFNEYLPFVPICYRLGSAYYSRGIQYEGSVSENDIFSNIYSWDN